MRMKRRGWMLAAALSVIMGGVARADEVTVGGETYRENVKVVGMKGEQLAVRVGREEKRFDWSKVLWMNVAGQEQFNKAEDARKEGNVKVALYQVAIRNSSSPTVKVLGGLRIAELREVEGDWPGAVGAFVEAYRMGGDPGMWGLRPKRLPEEPAKLKASADKIDAVLNNLMKDSDQRNLLTWKLEMLTKAGDERAAKVQRELSQLDAQKDAGKGSGFYGMTAGGKNVVYILDHSGSMLDTFDFLRQEAIRTVVKTPADEKFNVILVSEQASVIFPALKEATEETKKDFATKLGNYRAQGMNDDLLEPFNEAFQKAFEMKPDVIFFLTDGHFDPRLSLVVAKLNKDQAVKVHTVAFVNHDPSYEDQLKAMARENGGTYRFVAEKELGK